MSNEAETTSKSAETPDSPDIGVAIAVVAGIALTLAGFFFLLFP